MPVRPSGCCVGGGPVAWGAALPAHAAGAGGRWPGRPDAEPCRRDAGTQAGGLPVTPGRVGSGSLKWPQAAQSPGQHLRTGETAFNAAAGIPVAPDYTGKRLTWRPLTVAGSAMRVQVMRTSRGRSYVRESKTELLLDSARTLRLVKRDQSPGLRLDSEAPSPFVEATCAALSGTCATNGTAVV
jgi:hypothetical protein